MPYVERVTKAGNTIEIERYFTSRYKKKGISRGDKVKPTKEEQEKVNTRQAERKLRILINANYGYGDYHLVLDYIRRKGEPDRTPEQMRQDIDVFLRECRKEYRKAGLEFKYIHVMEIGKKGARHHHLVVNKIDTEILQRCWYKAYEGHNRVKVFPLDDSGNYAELASYLIKYTGTHKKGTDGALQGNIYNNKLGKTDAEYTAAVDNGSYGNFVKDSAGYGLAQWTYWSRKQALLNHAKQAGVSIADLNMQLGFLWEELQGYTAVMDALKKAGSVRAASDAVLTGYEKPADQSETVKKKRAEYGEGYYKKYAAGNGTKYYRVRKSWTDAASQLGAFTSLENAKSACKAGYTVYDDNGKAVYTAAGQQASAGVPFSVQVDILDLNIRTGAGTNYAKTGETTGKGVFTIVEVKAGQGASAGWGRLKSGAGWISLDYATRLA